MYISPLSSGLYIGYRGSFRLRNAGNGVWPIVNEVRRELERLSEAGLGAAGGVHSPKYFDDNRWTKAHSSAVYMPLPGRRLWTESNERHTWEMEQQLIQLARLVTRKRGKGDKEEGGYDGGALVTPGAVFETRYDPYTSLASISGILLGDKSTSTDFGALACPADAEAILRLMVMSLPANATAILWRGEVSLSGHQLLEAEGTLFSGPVFELLHSKLDDPRKKMLVLERREIPGRYDLAILSTPKHVETERSGEMTASGRQTICVFAL